MLVDDILARHGLDGPAALLPHQGLSTTAWATRDCVVKLAHPQFRDEVYTETLVSPVARAAGVRTPALLGWAREPDLAYSIWERVAAQPLGEGGDPAVWREVGRQLARLHAIESCADPRGLLNKRNKRDARPYLQQLPPERATFFARWIDQCDRLIGNSSLPRRLLHYDVHELNVLSAAEGATLIDWADAAWGDPACEFASILMPLVPVVLQGYEEVASLGAGAEARIVRASIGQAVRQLVTKDWSEPLDRLMDFVRDQPPSRFRDCLPR